LDLSFCSDEQNKRKQLFRLEQKYINKYLPDLNINQVAGSTLGFKRNQTNKLELNLSLYKNKFYTKLPKPPVTTDTILKLKLYSKNKTINMYNQNGLLYKQFHSIKDAGAFIGLSASSVSLYIKTGKL
jgi:hypothetical protein